MERKRKITQIDGGVILITIFVIYHTYKFGFLWYLIPFYILGPLYFSLILYLKIKVMKRGKNPKEISPKA